jgi:integrase
MAQREILTVSTPTDNRWRVKFEHQGKNYTLFKRPDASQNFYVHLQVKHRRFKKALDTQDVDLAIKRACLFIDSLVDQKWLEPAPQMHQENIFSLEDIFCVYRGIASISPRTVKTNILALLKIFERVEGRGRPSSSIQLCEVNRSLVTRYQDEAVRRYCARAPKDDVSQREARDRSLRSTRSAICQARSIFSKKASQNLVERYEEAGITLPASISEFVECKLRGRLAKGEYNVPGDDVIQKAFSEVEALLETDPEAYKGFWLAIGAGLRRKEIKFCRWDHIVERNGHWWVCGGIGKNGQVINVPMQTAAYKKLAPFRKQDGWIVNERSDRWAKRLSAWMRKLGWQTQKTLHELRAYIGSLIYRKDPVAAMRFMRHKSISVTERNYVRYHQQSLPLDVL